MTAEDNKRCLLDETKLCDDCGECDRCDLDPNKICDNCCKCLALEDDDGEFRTVTLDGSTGKASVRHGRAGESAPKNAVPVMHFEQEQPDELTPELIAYWEQKLLEYGEAPADDGFGEIRVNTRVPVKGVRKRRDRNF